MKYRFVILLCFSFTFSFAQDLKIPIDTAYVTNHSVTIKGKQITYTAETGFQPVWNTEVI